MIKKYWVVIVYVRSREFDSLKLIYDIKKIQCSVLFGKFEFSEDEEKCNQIIQRR